MSSPNKTLQTKLPLPDSSLSAIAKLEEPDDFPLQEQFVCNTPVHISCMQPQPSTYSSGNHVLSYTHTDLYN